MLSPITRSIKPELPPRQTPLESLFQITETEKTIQMGRFTTSMHGRQVQQRTPERPSIDGVSFLNSEFESLIRLHQSPERKHVSLRVHLVQTMINLGTIRTEVRRNLQSNRLRTFLNLVPLPIILRIELVKRHVTYPVLCRC